MEHKSEIEVADFDRLLSKLELVKVQPATKDLLINLKNSGQPKVEAYVHRERIARIVALPKSFELEFISIWIQSQRKRLREELIHGLKFLDAHSP